jgi:23S rRNA (adenine1618-N6)-methyltransferase
MTNKLLHPRNIHNSKYDFKKLTSNSSELSKFIKKSKSGAASIDFSNSNALIELNKSLLITHYGLSYWNLPEGHLCPPIPSRVDYIHYIADLIKVTDSSDIPVGKTVKGLDIGTGAGCIYPLLGNAVYGWRFVGTDINSDSINSSKEILSKNPKFKKNISLRFQKSTSDIFLNIIKRDEVFDFSMCNPPFYSSAEEARLKNLEKNKKMSLSGKRNFGGSESELWCNGGELEFIKKMIHQSFEVKDRCRWFTTLVSNNDNLNPLKSICREAGAEEIKVIKMSTPNKVSHILAWTFL